MYKNGPYKVLDSKKIYKNPWISVREDKVIHPNGKEGIFGVVDVGCEGLGGIAVLAINDKKEAYLVKMYQYAIAKESIEVVCGGIEKEESSFEAAKRELKEEVGVEAKEIIDLGEVYSITTIIKSKSYLFLALDIKEGENNLDETESLEVIKIPFDKLVEMVQGSEIFDNTSCTLILKANKYFNDIEKNT